MNRYKVIDKIWEFIWDNNLQGDSPTRKLLLELRKCMEEDSLYIEYLETTLRNIRTHTNFTFEDFQRSLCDRKDGLP